MFWRVKKTPQQKNIELWQNRYDEASKELCKLSWLQKIVGLPKHKEELQVRINKLTNELNNASRRLIEAKYDCL